MRDMDASKTVLVKDESIAKCASRVKNRLRYVTSLLKDHPPPVGSEKCMMIVHDGAVKGFVLVGNEPISIGRSDDADIQMMDSNVSREHAFVEKRGEDDWALIDNNSSNGVYINGAKIEEKELRDGDLIKIGEFELIFLKNDSL